MSGLKMRKCWWCGNQNEVRITEQERMELLKMWDKQGYLDAYYSQGVDKILGRRSNE